MHHIHRLALLSILYLYILFLYSIFELHDQHFTIGKSRKKSKKGHSLLLIIVKSLKKHSKINKNFQK